MGTVIVFEGKKNLIIGVKEEYALGFFKNLSVRQGDNSPTSGTVFLAKNVESCGYNSLLENSHHSPRLLKCPPNGYGKRTCKLTPHWAEKLLKFWNVIKSSRFS